MTSNANLNRLIKEHNNIVRRISSIPRRYPHTANTTTRYEGPHRGMRSNIPNNVLNQLKADMQRWRNAKLALARAFRPNFNPANLYFSGNHSSEIEAFNKSNARSRANAARVRARSAAIRGRAATTLQKHWRGRKTRMNLTYPTPSPPNWPRMRNLAIALGLKQNNTTRGYTMTPNQMKRMFFMLSRKYK